MEIVEKIPLYLVYYVSLMVNGDRVEISPMLTWPWFLFLNLYIISSVQVIQGKGTKT